MMHRLTNRRAKTTRIVMSDDKYSSPNSSSKSLLAGPMAVAAP